MHETLTISRPSCRDLELSLNCETGRFSDPVFKPGHDHELQTAKIRARQRDPRLCLRSLNKSFVSRR